MVSVVQSVATFQLLAMCAIFPLAFFDMPLPVPECSPPVHPFSFLNPTHTSELSSGVSSSGKPSLTLDCSRPVPSLLLDYAYIKEIF